MQVQLRQQSEEMNPLKRKIPSIWEGDWYAAATQYQLQAYGKRKDPAKVATRN
jgi:hypothetical protein